MSVPEPAVLLTFEEEKAIRDAIVSPFDPRRREQVYVAVERIIANRLADVIRVEDLPALLAEAMAVAWDEGVRWTGLNVTFARTSNPYRTPTGSPDEGGAS